MEQNSSPPKGSEILLPCTYTLLDPSRVVPAYCSIDRSIRQKWWSEPPNSFSMLTDGLTSAPPGVSALPEGPMTLGLPTSSRMQGLNSVVVRTLDGSYSASWPLGCHVLVSLLPGYSDYYYPAATSRVANSTLIRRGRFMSPREASSSRSRILSVPIRSGTTMEQRLRRYSQIVYRG